jgi:non-specific serine/threonine protein kinase
MFVELVISPTGRLRCEPVVVPPEQVESRVAVDERLGTALCEAFTESASRGLMLLAGPAASGRLPVDLQFWRRWVLRFFKTVGQLTAAEINSVQEALENGKPKPLAAAIVARLPPPNPLELAAIVAEAPPMRGLEFLTPDLLTGLWNELIPALGPQAALRRGGFRGLLAEVIPNFHLLGRVTFHLAENKRDPDHPFAFLATYAERLSSKSQVQHLPLGAALRQYAAAKDQAKLAELLTPVRDASIGSPMVSELLDSRAIFQPQAWTVAQAHRFLTEIPAMEEAGLGVRVPDWWAARREVRPQVQVRIGDQRGNGVGLGSLLDFSATLSLDGTPLTQEERDALLAATDGLALLRGRWVEIDARKLNEALRHWQELEEEHADGISFLDGMRLLAGVTPDGGGDAADEWASIRTGTWLQEVLQRLRSPGEIEGCEPGTGLRATLRPYQADGVRWLWFMLRLGLGACLADDMGLGKTIQVIDLILRLQGGGSTSKRAANREEGETPAGLRAGPSLLVVPASLVGNWKGELEKFAPQLRVCLAHHSEMDAASLDQIARQPARELAKYDVVITTYTLVRREEWPRKVDWRLVVLDEAQAIRNAGSAQSKAVRQLRSAGRVILTGTPVENHLGDLWSLFDFCVPGLLGSIAQFRTFVKTVQKNSAVEGMAALRRLVKPYILRRMKSDPRIVPDLPDKTELTVSCGLSKKQVVLYEKVTADVSRMLESTDGIQRKGLVLSLLMRLKQLCNHPDQFLGQPGFEPGESGKFQVLRQICETIREQQGKVLVFTQFQSLCDPLAAYLSTIFQKPGLVLHGEVPVKQRRELVTRFQEREDLPFFVISLKAGGSGLNLTAASHVIHFDRWWNPAVENQATDRAYRIGQKRNVLVHKLVCRGTLEERIDQTLRDKQELADDILQEGGEKLLTEMSDDELLRFVSLDVTRATDDD